MASTKNNVTAAIAADPELEGLYSTYTGAATKADAAKIAKTDYVKINAGRNVIRILPGPKGSDGPFRTIWQHFLRGTTNNLTVVNCPQKEQGLYCPVCDHAETLKHSVAKTDQAMGKDIEAKSTVLCYAIHRNPSKDDKALGVLRLPFGVYSKILTLRFDPEVIEAFEENTQQSVNPEEGVDFTHPAFGFDIVIEKTGSGKTGTKYEAKAVIVRLGKTPAMDNIDDLKMALKKRPNLELLAAVLSETELRAALDAAAGTAPEGEADQKALPEGTVTTTATAKVEGELHNVAAPKDEHGNDIPF